MDDSKEIFSGPIHAEYALERSDVKDALRLSGRMKSRLGLHIFQSLLAVFGIVVFLSSIMVNPSNLLHYFLVLLCLLILGLIWIYPFVSQRQAVRKTVDGRRIEIKLTAEHLWVSIPQSGMDEFFQLSDIAPVRQNDRIFLLNLPGEVMLVIPKRALPSGSEAAAAAILEGTGAAFKQPDGEERPAAEEPSGVREPSEAATEDATEESLENALGESSGEPAEQTAEEDDF
ncbi:MAG: hypothetical protein HFE86_03550 [Clostridiales bacterium]|nr:hypothetical protein [Clostridiales bacterium]